MNCKAQQKRKIKKILFLTFFLLLSRVFFLICCLIFYAIFFFYFLKIEFSLLELKWSCKKELNWKEWLCATFMCKFQFFNYCYHLIILLIDLFNKEEREREKTQTIREFVVEQYKKNLRYIHTLLTGAGFHFILSLSLLLHNLILK